MAKYTHRQMSREVTWAHLPVRKKSSPWVGRCPSSDRLDNALFALFSLPVTASSGMGGSTV